MKMPDKIHVAVEVDFPDIGWVPAYRAAAEHIPDLLREVEIFNANHPIGTPVHAYPGTREGRRLVTTTRSRAWNVGGTAVVAVRGYPGGIALTHVDVVGQEAPVTWQGLGGDQA